MAKFAPGQSGNAAGRPRGVPNPQARLRASIEKDIPEIIAQLVMAAKGGDTRAAEILISRVLPPIRASETPQVIPMPGQTLTERATAVLEAVSQGTLAPTQGSALLGAVAQLAKIFETDELQRRVEALEGRNNG